MGITRRATTTIVAMAAVLVVGCGGMTVSGLQTKPENYEGKRIKVVARVIATKDVPLTDYDYYKVTDDTGQLWVQTRRGVPLKGARYRVEGIFKRPGGAVAGMLLGDFIIEEHKRAEVQ